MLEVRRAFPVLGLLWAFGCGGADGPTEPTAGGPTPSEVVCGRSVPVAAIDAVLAASVAAAAPGDCLVLADGNYAGLTLRTQGTADRPIVLRAANRGRAVFDSGVLRLDRASYTVLEGFTITTSGGRVTVDARTRLVGVLLTDSNNCRVTRCTFRLAGHAVNTQWLMIGGNSNDNRVDHSEFGPNTVDGVHFLWPAGAPDIAGVTPPADRSAWADYRSPRNPNMARNTRIDHNHFHDHALGTAECIVLGGLGVTGDYQETHTTVEQNLFTNCDGDPEIVSIKASNNVIRYNTLRTSAGGFVSRAGNRNEIYGNFILQGGKAASAGFRLHEKDHVAYNNYIENTADYPINLGSGDRYDAAGFTHAQVFRARVVHNSVVTNNGRAVIIGWGSNELPPVDCVFANNIVSGGLTQLTLALPGNTFFTRNLVNPTMAAEGGLLRLTASSPAVDVADPAYFPFVADDIDGQPRSTADIGADELSAAPILRRPLTAADVGPEAP